MELAAAGMGVKVGGTPDHQPGREEQYSLQDQQGAVHDACQIWPSRADSPARS